MAMKVLILCGGMGSRLRPVLPDGVKPLANVNGRPFLEWLLMSLSAQGIEEVVLCTGHGGPAIEARLGDGRKLGLQITYSFETTPLGTGGAIRLALGHGLDQCVAVLNGDSYCGVDLRQLEAFHIEHAAAASLWLVPVANRARYGSVDIDGDGHITGFREKSAARQPGLISAGAYVLGPAALECLGSDGAMSIENDVFPRLVGRGLFGIVGEGPFIDIGTPDDLARAGRLLVGTTVQLEARVDSGWRRNRLVAHLNGSLAVQRDTLASCTDQVLTAAQMIAVAFATDHKLLLCGNGGSAADSQHMATEFTSRLNREVERPGLPAIALTTDTSFITAFSNDVGFEGVFKRQVGALGKAGDVLIGISTSGNSPNVVLAVRAARQLGIGTIGLVGEGGILTGEVDCAVVIPSRDTQYIQESLLPVEHAVCDLVEQALFRHVQRQPVATGAR